MTSAPREMPRVMVSGLKPAPSMPLGTRMPTLSGGPHWSGICQCRLAYFDHAATWGFTGLASRIVAGPSWRMFVSPGFLTRYRLCRPRLMARGQVRCRRGGLRCCGLVMLAMTWARTARAWSGGESRADGPAHDPQGALEPDPVRVDPGAGGGGAG